MGKRLGQELDEVKEEKKKKILKVAPLFWQYAALLPQLR